MNKTTCKAQIRVSEGYFPLGAKRGALSSSVCPVARRLSGYRTSVFPTPFHFRVVFFPDTNAFQWLALKFQPVSSVGGKAKSSSLEATGQKSSFCAGRELKSKSRSQGQEGKEKWHYGIFRIKFSGQPRISPSSFFPDQWRSWLGFPKKTHHLLLIRCFRATTSLLGTWVALIWGKNLIVVPKCKLFLKFE